MIYSVWNQGAGDFEYYEDGVPQQTLNVEKPSHISDRTLGATVDQAAWPLPASARLTCRGPVPIGRIAARKTGLALGSLTDDLSLAKIALLGLAAYVAVKTLEPKRRRRTR